MVAVSSEFLLPDIITKATPLSIQIPIECAQLQLNMIFFFPALSTSLLYIYPQNYR